MNQLGTESLFISELIGASVDGIFLLDNDYQIIAWNNKMAEFSDIPAYDAIGNKIDALSFHFSQQFFLEGLKKAFKNKGQILNGRFVFERKDKNYNCQASVSPFKLLESDGLGCMVIMRELPSKNVKKSRFKPLVEESPIATAIFHKDGRAKYFNKAHGEIWGTRHKMDTRAVERYNILNDQQLVDLGIMAFIQKGFAGEPCDIPPVVYNPYYTASNKELEEDDKKFVKGHLFPIKNSSGELEEVVLVLTDITFQKQAEQILSDTHQKFQMLTKGLPGVIYEYEEIGENPHQFRYISQGCEEMFGFTPEDVMADASLLEKRIHPEDISGFRDTTLSSEFEAKNWEWQGRIIIEGVEKWIKGKSNPTKLNDGTIVRYGLLLDITEKKEVERQHKITEERLKLALEGAELGLWEWDLKKGKSILNKSWASKLGYKNIEFSEKYMQWETMVHPEDLPETKAKIDAHFEGKTETFQAEYRIQNKSGDWVWVMDRGRVTELSKKGVVKTVAGTLLDINDSKVIQNTIKQNEQLFTQLFDNAPLGVVLLDREHKVVQMNQGFENMFGFNKDDIVGNQLNNIIVPDEKSQESMDINMLTAEGAVGVLESHRLHKDGSLIPVIIYGVPVSLNNKTIGIYGIYVNITDRVNVERELQIRNNELDNFVYKVSHDLRAPLSSILGLVNLANIENNEDDIREYITIIESRVKQLDSFINDVLSHSKNLKMEVSVDKIEFQKVIDDCFTDLNYLPKADLIQKNISISGADYYNDKWRINEIFRNLISNTIKYLDPKEENPYVNIDIRVSEEEVKLTFEDNGIGIDDDSLPKIFDMFYRATTQSEGSGIGLYIVKNAIEKLRGTVSLGSSKDMGTTFVINLPNQAINRGN
jgi:PAS domain S-box-containing protein